MTDTTQEQVNQLRQELQDARNEKDGTLQMLWLIVKSQGGRVVVDEELLDANEGAMKRFQTHHDEEKKQLVFEAS